MTFRQVLAGSRLRYRDIRPAYPIGCDLNAMIGSRCKSAPDSAYVLSAVLEALTIYF